MTSQYLKIKILDTGMIGTVSPLLFGAQLGVTRPEDWESFYDDVWHYETVEDAKQALECWDGHGEPEGWHRHPKTARRREHGDPGRETIRE